MISRQKTLLHRDPDNAIYKVSEVEITRFMNNSIAHSSISILFILIFYLIISGESYLSIFVISYWYFSILNRLRGFRQLLDISSYMLTY